MPRARYQFTEEDVPVVHRWAHAKFRDTAWPQYDVARNARNQFPREPPTAAELQQWCDQYLDAPQWTQLQALIRAARRDTRQTRTVRLTAGAHARLHALAVREQLTLSETIERHLADGTVASAPKDTPSPPVMNPPAQKTTSTAPQNTRRAAVSPRKQGTALVTSKKGVCYLTIKIGRENCSIMRIRNYTIDVQDKRDMRRLHPDIAFDWKKIARQLAEKREVCRRYRSRRRRAPRPRLPREPFYGVIDPQTSTVYVNDPGNIMGVGALLDHLLAEERFRNTTTRTNDDDGVPDADEPFLEEPGRWQ